MDTTIVNLSNLETTILFVLGVLAALVAVDKGVEAFRHLFFAAVLCKKRTKTTG